MSEGQRPTRRQAIAGWGLFIGIILVGQLVMIGLVSVFLGGN